MRWRSASARRCCAFVDPDGLKLSLVGVEGAEKEPAWTNGDVPAEHALRGFHGVKLMLDSAGPTGDVLTKVLGFTKAGQEGTVTRFVAKDATYGGVVDIQEAKDFLAWPHGPRLRASHRVPRCR